VILHQSTPFVHIYVQEPADELEQQRISDNYVRVNIGMSFYHHCLCFSKIEANGDLDKGEELIRGGDDVETYYMIGRGPRSIHLVAVDLMGWLDKWGYD